MKMPTKAFLEFTGFMELITDIIYHVREAMAGDGINQHKHSRAGIISCALAVESSVNCLLNELNLPSRSSSDLERLPSLTKLDICLRLRTNNTKSISRGDSRIAIIAELISIRNDFVHPKRQSVDAEWDVDPEAPEGYKINFEHSVKVYDKLALPKTSLHWSKFHAETVAKATFDFFDLIFRELLELDLGEVYHIVGSRMVAELNEEGSKLIASGPLDEYEELLVWASENGLEVRFIHEVK